jgi:hypothetical protein
MDEPGEVSGVEIDLLKQGGKKLGRVEFIQIFPKELLTVHDPPGANVKEIDCSQGVFLETAEDVGIIAAGASQLLAFGDLADGGEEIAVAGGLLKALVLRSLNHPGFQGRDEFAVPAFKESTQIGDGFGIALVCRETLDARSLATFDVVLKAGARVIASEIYGARWDLEVAVDEMDDSMRQASRKIRTKIL